MENGFSKKKASDGNRDNEKIFRTDVSRPYPLTHPSGTAVCFCTMVTDFVC